MKDYALYYASLGIPVFPCTNTKKPLLRKDKDANGKEIPGTGGFHKASTDPKKINGWWERWPNAMIGFPTGKKSGIDILDLDLDKEKGKDGTKKIPDWENRSNIISRTPRGGLHLWYKANGREIPCTTDDIDFGVDTRGTGGYAFLPPSVGEVGEYRFIKGSELDFKDMPEFPSDLASRLKHKKEFKKYEGPGITGNIELIKLALIAMSNEDIGWQEWNNIGMATWAASGGSEEGFEAFKSWSHKSDKFDALHTRERWNHFVESPPDRTGEGKLFALAYEANPGWDDEYHKKIADSIGMAGGQASADQVQYLKENIWKNNELNGGGVILPPVSQSNNSRLANLNERFCILPVAGKMRILEFTKVRDRQMAVFYTPYDFKVMLDNVLVKTGKDKFMGQGSWWLTQSKRRQYDGLVFHPGEIDVVNGRLNLWQGWGIEPKKGNWGLLKQHIFDILANKNKEFFDYIVWWTAWTLQNPGKPAGVVLVFRGGRGAGKGLFGRELKKAFGQHGIHISSAGHLSGRFNAHLMDCALLFADEAFWPGDKAGEGTLKRMITEDVLFIERKGFDGFEVDNNLHIIMASNSDWVVPAGIEERRFAVFDTCEDKRQLASYFKPLYEEIAAGGTAAMMYDLLAMDLGDWHPRDSIPKNEALADQQNQTLSHFDQLWLDLLHAGSIPGSTQKNPSITASRILFDFARERSPGLKNVSDHLLARNFKKKGCTRDHDLRIGGRGGPRGLQFPSLTSAREAWVKGVRTVWENPDLTEWVCEQI